MTDDKTAVFQEKLLSAHLAHVILHLSLWLRDSQLCAACYSNLNKAVASSACPCWWCEYTQPPFCLPPLPLRMMWPSQSENSWSQSQTSVPQQAQGAGTHTNKVEGHCSSCWASQPPSQAVQEDDADNSLLGYLVSQIVVTDFFSKDGNKWFSMHLHY